MPWITVFNKAAGLPSVSDALRLGSPTRGDRVAPGCVSVTVAFIDDERRPSGKLAPARSGPRMPPCYRFRRSAGPYVADCEGSNATFPGSPRKGSGLNPGANLMAGPTYVPSSGQATMPSTELVAPDLRSYVAPLRRRKWWVIWTAVLGLVGTGTYVLVAHKEYTASAQLLVQPTRGSISLNNTQQTISPTDVATQIQLAESAPVLTLAEAALKFQPAVSVSEVGTTDVMSISATSTSKTQAVLVAQHLRPRVFVSARRRWRSRTSRPPSCNSNSRSRPSAVSSISFRSTRREPPL